MTFPANRLPPLNGNSQEEIDLYWMNQALGLAIKAQDVGEVPVGAVIVKDNKLIATGYNQSIATHDPSNHAEMVAMRQAGKVLQNYRLVGCTLYVTLEPCSMCAGAMVHARLKEVVFATSDPRTGAAGSVINLLQHPQFNHKILIRQGVLLPEAKALLTNFFKEKRNS